MTNVSSNQVHQQPQASQYNPNARTETTCNAVNWMISKAQALNTHDYMPEFYFKGTLPSRMVKEVLAYCKTVNAKYHDGSSRSSRTWRIGEVDFTFKKGCYNGTSNTVSLMVTDYTYLDMCPGLYQD